MMIIVLQNQISFIRNNRFKILNMNSNLLSISRTPLKNKVFNLLLLIGCIMLISNAQNCNANCWKCNNVDVCTNCKIGSYLTKNYTCQACPIGCLQCYSSSLCTKCSLGHVLNTTSNTCILCPDNCVQCSLSLDAIRCDDCGVGAYLSNYNRQCEPCIQFCSECSGPNNCKLCSEGFGLNENDQRCQTCSDYCYYCQSINGSQIMGCKLCQQKYFVDSNNAETCQPCTQNCLNCNSSSWCTTCEDNYYPALDESSTSVNYCNSCPDQNCIICSQNNPAVCLDCETGYFFTNSSSKCVKCTDNCLECLSDSICQNCLAGYYMDTNSNCKICGTACSECQGANNCTKCVGSYYLSYGNCEVCNYGCAKCSARDQCQACISYQYALTQAQCETCSTFMWKCIACLNSTFCIECADNYYLYNGQCITNNDGLSTWGIILIILSVAIVIGALIFAVIKKREANAAEAEEQRGAYLEIP